MGKQIKSKKTENLGKGKVTPVQIAFIVDRYLSDHNYTQTRSTYRTEASHLIADSPVQEAPKSLLSLGAMLDEYICLKEQKVMFDQEKFKLEQEKFQVQTLLRGMQDVMNAYNAGGSSNPLPPRVSSTAPKPSAMLPKNDQTVGSPAGLMYSTPVMMTASRPSCTRMDPANFSTPVTNHPILKRLNDSKDVPYAPVTAKRPRGHLKGNRLLAKGTGILSQSSNIANNQENALPLCAVQSISRDNVPKGSPVQGSSVAKCLFNQPSQSPPTNSSGPKTPPLETSSQTNKSVSPLEVISGATSSNNVSTPQHVISTNCTQISSKAIRVSPVKQIAYHSIERNHCISSSPVKTSLKRIGKRDHVKGKLDFDGSDMPKNSENPFNAGVTISQSNEEVDIFDFDLPNLDALGVDFSLAELLVDFDLDGQGTDYSCKPALGSPDSISGSPNKLGDIEMAANQVLSEFSSTATETLSEKDMNIQDPNSMTSPKSITKCIKILSPVKNRTSSPPDQENLCARN
ncbi:uncharacterized protein LOC132295646 [Cornus florida]|uniref:uncharacterized protein LOC132295646 n=1 Tax=Cornus florida TaxID=4283 RepID=UPI002896FE4B|nr:uncharacterized protein LOC132295646 [Cornus florida]